MEIFVLLYLQLYNIDNHIVGDIVLDIVLDIVQDMNFDNWNVDDILNIHEWSASVLRHLLIEKNLLVRSVEQTLLIQFVDLIEPS